MRRTFAVVGVVEDGRNRDPGLPPPGQTATTLDVRQGEPFTLAVRALYPDMTPVALSGEVTLTVRKTSPPGVNVPGFTVVLSGVSGDVVLLDASAGNVNIQPGRWLFDVWMVTGSGDRVCLVPTSGLVITPSENLPN
mgnify:CR=1 FL=1|jgi:hypothetical protein